MLLFAAHDPGARNHIRPIIEYAQSLRKTIEIINLHTQPELMDDGQALAYVQRSRPTLLIAGCSMNRGEWPLVRACKSTAAKTAVMVDIGAEVKLDTISPEDFPDRFMVTNKGCVDELIGYGAVSGIVTITGSAHLEALATRRFDGADNSTKGEYGLGWHDNLVAFFCNPDTSTSIDAVVSLAKMLPGVPLTNQTVIVRPHPRTTEKHLLEEACREFPFLRYDSGDQIPTPQLLKSCLFSLTMASTVSLESQVMRVPSAFFQAGWDYYDSDQRYRNLDGMHRIRTEEELTEFIQAVLDGRGLKDPAGLENYAGALDRIWQVITSLRRQP